MHKPHAVVLQLSAAGYITDFVSYNENGDTLLGTVKPALIDKLRRDARFACGVFYGYHRDVGSDLVDFRSHTGALGDGSLQMVIDRQTGQCYCDIDRHSPYSDVVGFLGHAFGEVIPGWFRRKRKAPALALLEADHVPPLPEALTQAPGVMFVAPPDEVIPDISGVIGKALSQLSEGKSGGVFALAEVQQNGTVKRVNAAIVQRIGEDFAIVGYIGKTWSPAGSDIHYGAALRWEWD